TNILFVCGGTFTGLEEIIANRLGKKLIGFNPEWGEDSNDPEARRLFLERVEVEDLVKYGMIPEFLGRLPILTTLDPLGEKELVRILVEPKNALIRQYQELFRLNGVELRVTEKALQDVARLALERGTGARGLRAILEDVMLDALYEIPDHADQLREFVVSPDVVRTKTFKKGRKSVRKTPKRRESA
ncbi:MAG TPA: ATP-dependent Clp protease ATP-binding subunit ClpX, partial [Planctomycetota bacterium]|nr:ATP-dependent Clp protease ATP-binding subunit ClpX [Planctomycetota bacterium]